MMDYFKISALPAHCVWTLFDIDTAMDSIRRLVGVIFNFVSICHGVIRMWKLLRDTKFVSQDLRSYVTWTPFDVDFIGIWDRN